MLPGTAPRIAIMFLSSKMSITLKPLVVTCLQPIWPGIFLFLMTLPGEVLVPMDPVSFRMSEPWLPGRPPKPCLRITLAKPFALGDTGDLDLLTLGEYFARLDLLAFFHGTHIIAWYFAQVIEITLAGLVLVAFIRLADARFLLLAESESAAHRSRLCP